MSQIDLDEELRLAIERFEKATGSWDEARIAKELRRRADEHREILRLSKEKGNDKVYK